MIRKSCESYKNMKKLICLFIVLLIFMGVNSFKTSVSGRTDDVIGLESETSYIIKNVSSGKYMDVQGGTDKNGQNVIVYEYGGSTNQRWKLNRITGDVYQLISLLPSGRVLDVTSSNIDIWNNVSMGYQKFTLKRNSDGTYLIKNGSKYVSLTDGEKNVGLSTSSKYAKWSFDEVKQGDADIYGFKYKDGKFLWMDTNYDSTSSFTDFENGFDDAGFNTYSFKNPKASTAYNNLKNDSIWVFRGHGYYYNGNPYASICFIDSNGNFYSGQDSAIIANSHLNKVTGLAIDDLPPNALSSEKCVMYIGCSTAVPYVVNGVSYDLLTSTYNKGAHFVMGTTDTIFTGQATLWTRDFCTAASYKNSTIASCLSFASYYIGGIDIEYKGDRNCLIHR